MELVRLNSPVPGNMGWGWEYHMEVLTPSWKGRLEPLWSDTSPSEDDDYDGPEYLRIGHAH